MLIPSIDLMGGKIVQLVQGEKKALEFTDFEAWIERFGSYPLVQLIDLDAAMRQGSNRELVARFAKKLPVQVGGGIRTLDDARNVLESGAQAVIIGSALIKGASVNIPFAEELASLISRERIVAAIDSRGGKVSVAGWKQGTELTPDDMIRALDTYVDGFLYTHIDGEGLMRGFPIEVAARLRSLTDKRLIVAGGITSQDEIDRLEAIGADSVVGMAVYTGQLKV